MKPVTTGTSANIDLTVRKKNDFYAFLWQGIITIPATGVYTFDIRSDDGSKLYIGTYNSIVTPVIINDGIRANVDASRALYLKAGDYPITIEFFQNYGDQGIELFWSSNAGISRQRVPDHAFSHPVDNIKYRCYDGTWNMLPDFNALTSVKTGTARNFDLVVRTRDANYGIAWKGEITIPADGNYTFETSFDDGSKLYLDTGKITLVDNNGSHAQKPATGNMNLKAGVYPITVSFLKRR